ncbi:hypothetical protein [Tropicibacter oceani]|uniref:Uncharacterized protein n=1 Tax=Tropicibacter oceani TaxID=3058420 RepID=A0ABY8QCS5_9RHOB|nr:hypothetical protein [Tropicibacter oceani]WGW02289.1 hypothetical protein QF118_10000 [Tropicibacter oceani]
MLWRALFLLILAVAASALATWYFGKEVLIALGLILVQIKVLSKKLWMVEWPVFLIWLKAQGAAFFRVELLKKWLMSTVLPLVMGRALLRRLRGFVERYLVGITALHARLLAWFAGLSRVEKVLAWGILLSGTLALSVTSLGLWLILFSVKVPLWLVAAAAALGKSVWVSIQKWAFKVVAFLQLGWLWKGVSRVLPARWLQRKRRIEFRMARAVVRRRRMTVRQLADRKDRLPFRIGVLLEYVFVPGGRGQGN